MKLFTETGGVFATNAYLIADEPTGQAVIFDAPDHTLAPLLDIASEQKFDVIGLWLTHGHIDHIADHAAVNRRFPAAKVLIHHLDQPKLHHPNSMFPLPFKVEPRTADGYLAEGDVLQIGALAVNVLHTPGHSPGHVVFHLPEEKIVIGGDLIFAGSVGRTDFPDCSYPALQQSIRNVMRLPAETRLLPGHGPATTLAAERGRNPFVQEALAI